MQLQPWEEAAKGDERRSRGANNPISVEFLKHLGVPITQRTMEEIDAQCELMPPQARRFILENCCGLILHDLARFWSNPAMREYTRGEKAGNTAGASWYMAMQYLILGKVPEASALAVNGCFLYQCIYTPVETLVELCGETFLDSVKRHKLRILRRGFCAIQTPQALKDFLENGLPDEYQGIMSCFDWVASKDKKMGYVGSISRDWESSSSTSNHQKSSSRASVGTQIHLILVDDTNDCRSHSFNVGSSTALKVVFNDYADKRGVSLRSLRFSYCGKTLFLSSVGNKSPDELNLAGRVVINVTHISAPAQESSSGSLIRKNKKAKNFKKSPNLNGRRKLKVDKPKQEAVKTLGEFMAQHSKMLTNLHEELQPRLKEIRNRLNALGLERQLPKQKKKNTRKKKTKGSADIQMLPSPGIGGKAGKPYFIIQVGEAENLYKTKKSRHLGQPGTSATLDLHGYSKSQALNTLNEMLPEWVDAAMRGEYPWVMRVQVVCGCGSQVLSEAVQQWINSTRNVSNAPKDSIW